MAFRFQTSRPIRAFTLIEMMISLVLVLMLMIGINMIFKMSSDVVGVGMFMGDTAANQRAIGDSMRRDAAGWMKNSPFFVINCRQEVLPDGSTVRRDHISFFANGRFRRQTANDGSYSSGTTANEAFVWYGHLARGMHYSPDPINGLDSIHNTLGRVAILLSPRNTATPAVTANAAFPQNPPVGTLDDYLLGSNTPLSPMCKNSGATTGSWKIEQSRYDLAHISADALRREIATYIDNNTTPIINYNVNGSINFQFEAISQLSRPLTSELVARNSPIMLPGCSQMIVEFADDLSDQSVNPQNPDYTKQDGIVDYVPAVNNDPAKPRATLWYGPGFGTNNRAYDVRQVPSTLPLAVGTRFRWSSGNLPATGNGNLSYVWLNSAPKMVRVLIKVEDPTNRVPDGIWCEYILGPQ